MAESQRTVQKVLACQEDLNFGEGAFTQTRGNGQFSVSKIRGFYPCNSQEELDNLDPLRFPKAVLVGTDELRFYSYNNGAYHPLATPSKTFTLAEAVANPSALEGDTVVISDRGNGLFEYKSTLLYTPDGYSIIAHSSQALVLVLTITQLVKAEYFGAIGDWNGSTGTDDYLPLQAGIDYVCTKGLGELHLGAKRYLSTGTLRDDNTVAANEFGRTVRLIGVAASEDPRDIPLSEIHFEGDIIGVQFDGNRSGGENLVFSGDGGAYSLGKDGIRHQAPRGFWRNLVIKDFRGDGIRYEFGNVSHFEHILMLNNKGWAFNPDGTGYVTPAGVSRPNDCNASTMIGLDGRLNGLGGVRTGVSSGFANNYYNTVMQSNVGVGVELNSDYNFFHGLYLENNETGVPSPRTDLRFNANADSCRVYGLYSNYDDVTNNKYEDLSTLQRNQIDGIFNLTEKSSTKELVIGNVGGGIPGHLQLKEGLTNFEFTLEGTSGDAQVDVKSSGAGLLTWNFESLFLEATTLPTLLNSWVTASSNGYKDVGYYKDAFGTVTLEGAIKDGTSTVGTSLFQLPTGYRPSAILSLTVSDASTGLPVVIQVAPSGVVTLRTAGPAFINFDGCSFRV